MARTLTPEAMLAMVPRQAVPFEQGPEGRVTLLRPKFVSPWLAWLQHVLPHPVFRVRVDDLGSFLWLQVDGRRTCGDLCQALRERFGDQAEPVQPRALTFLYQMLQGRFITLEEA